MTNARVAIRGNRLVLAGAILYLAEWVAIIPAGQTGPIDPGTKSPSQIFNIYASHPQGAAFIATWCSLVLLGRVLIITGLRRSLSSVGADGPLMAWAVAAMAVSVALEVVDVAIVAAGGALAHQGASLELVGAMDTLAAVVWRTLFAPLGLAIGLSAWSMLRSRAFATWICWVGLAASAILVVGGMLSGPGYNESGFSRSMGNVAGVGVPLFWVWMLATGIVLYRRAGQPAHESVEAALA